MCAYFQIDTVLHQKRVTAGGQNKPGYRCVQYICHLNVPTRHAISHVHTLFVHFTEYGHCIHVHVVYIYHTTEHLYRVKGK